MRITIAGGAGAVGLVQTILLAAAGHEVTVLSSRPGGGGSFAELGRARALRLSCPDVEIPDLPATAIALAAEPGAIGAAQDAVVATTKTMALAPAFAARLLAVPRVPGAPILAFGSGLMPWTFPPGDPRRELPSLAGPAAFCRALAGAPLLGGVLTRYGAALVGPGAVRSIFAGGRKNAIGRVDHAAPDAGARELAAAFGGAGLETTFPDLGAAMFGKLAFNLMVSVAPSLFGFGGRRDLPRAFVRVLGELAGEVQALAAAAGVAVPRANVAEAVDVIAGDGVPSILQDLRRGRPTERGTYVGALVELGQREGIATPAITLLDRLLG